MFWNEETQSGWEKFNSLQRDNPETYFIKIG